MIFFGGDPQSPDLKHSDVLEKSLHNDKTFPAPTQDHGENNNNNNNDNDPQLLNNINVPTDRNECCDVRSAYSCYIECGS